MALKAIGIVKEEIAIIRQGYEMAMADRLDSQGAAAKYICDALESRITNRIEKECVEPWGLRMSSNRDAVTPESLLFLLVYSTIFFPIWVGIPYFAASWMTGNPIPEWFTALLVIVSFFVFGPFCRRMRVWFGPWQRFHAWAYKKPSA